MIAGHEREVAALRDGLRGSRPHHAWLLAGPKGLGKATLAKQVAADLLAESRGEPGEATAALIAAWSHPDYLLLDRLPADRKLRERPRAEWPASIDLAKNINIDQVRELIRRFGTRPTFSERRFVIVDAADDLERAGANALLKALEEPPPGTTFLLVSHLPGRLLPTIRSRCRVLSFECLRDEAMRAALTAALPDAHPGEIAALAAAGEGAPGRALAFAGLDMAGLDKAMTEIVRDGDPSSKHRAALAKALALKTAQQRYEAFLARAPSFIAARAKERGAGAGRAVELWSEARVLAGSAIGLGLDPQMVSFQLGTIISRLHSPR